MTSRGEVDPVYDANYYKVQKILLDKKFQERIKAFKGWFEQFGCPIPTRGFRDLKAYDAWNEGLQKTYFKWHKSKKFRDAVKEITGGSDRITPEQQRQIYDLEDTMLPTVTYKRYFDTILADIGLDPKNQDDRDWLEEHIFFNRQGYEKPKFLVKFIVADKEKGTEPELWVRYFGYTRPSDVVSEAIEDFQKLLPDYRGKNKAKDESLIVRDREVYEVWLEVKKANPFKGRDRRERGQSIAVITAKKLKKKYPKLNKTLVEKIIQGFRE